jgi:two-component system NarL family sensor kinase
VTTLLDRFAASLSASESESLDAFRDYAAWRAARKPGEFAPSDDDDVDIRNYLLDLRIAGAGRKKLGWQVAALKRFYAWARDEGLIESSPFDDYNFDRPLLSRNEIRRRQDALTADPREREIARLRALNRLADQLNRSTEMQTALDATLETVVEIMGLQTAWVFLWTESGLTKYLPNVPAPHDFALCADCGLPPGLEQRHEYYLRQPGDCHCQALLRRGHLTRAVNVVECTRLQDAAEAAGDTRGLLFHATVPLVVQDQPVGIINVATDEWQFLSAADLQLLSAVGAQASVALERARLFARSAELGAAEERNRLAREIHDTLAQGLTAIALQLETADALLEAGTDSAHARHAVRQALTLTRQNLDEARRSVFDLRAAPLEGRTLAEALDALAQEWSARWKLPVAFEVSGSPHPLPLRVEASLYRMAQEALTNVVRHSKARRAALHLAVTARHVQLTIADDGKGFDPSQTPKGRYGLIGISERVKLLGGKFRLESQPGAGTRLEVKIPLKRRGVTREA